MVRQLKKAQQRLDRQRSRRRRNVLLVTVGATAAAAAVPQVRTWVIRKFSGDSSSGYGAIGSYTTIDEQIEVDVPVSTAYNQWTQFEEFPRFMDGVERVDQLDDTRLHWVATIAGKRAEWDAKILEQQPDTRITWTSTDGKDTRGTVSFDKLGEGRTRIRLSMTTAPRGSRRRWARRRARPPPCPRRPRAVPRADRGSRHRDGRLARRGSVRRRDRRRLRTT